MSHRISVRENLQVCQWVPVVMTLCLTIAVANGIRDNSEFTWWTASAVAATWMAYETAVAFCKLSVPYVQIHTDSFDYSENLETTFVPDYSVSAIAIATHQQYFLGSLQAVHHRYTIWSDLDANPIILESKSTSSTPDPLDSLIARLKARVLRRAREELLSGRAVHGDCWSLNTRHLRWDAEGRSHVIAPDQLAACEEYDNQVCIWREGQDAPIVKFPESGRNAILLHQLLQPGEVEEPFPQPARPTTMGRMLFERRIDAGAKLYYITAAAFVFAFGAYMHLFVVRDAVTWRAATVMMLAAIPILLIGYRSANAAHQYFENAVRHVGLFGNRTIYYCDVDQMRYQVTRQFHQGIYCGIEVELLLTPRQNPELGSIKHCFTVLKHDQAMDLVATRISKLIAARMSRELQEGQSIPWSEQVILEPAGLRYRGVGASNQVDFQSISYRDIGRQTIDEGSLRLYRLGESEPFLQVGSSTMNFDAGIRVIEMLRNGSTHDLHDIGNHNDERRAAVAGAA